MTQEEKNNIQARLDKANKIEGKIKVIKNALNILDCGTFYLNAGRYQSDHEEVARAIKLIESSVRREFGNKIAELKAEFEEL